jgi:hypothetical protein
MQRAGDLLRQVPVDIFMPHQTDDAAGHGWRHSPGLLTSSINTTLDRAKTKEKVFPSPGHQNAGTRCGQAHGTARHRTYQATARADA